MIACFSFEIIIFQMHAAKEFCAILSPFFCLPIIWVGGDEFKILNMHSIDLCSAF